MTDTSHIVPAIGDEANSEAAAVPDYMSNPNAVLMDLGATWRYGQPPDYSKTRRFYADTKRMNHPQGSLPSLVENLVKNWEIEASFKPNLSDWRTVNLSKYSFSMNGGRGKPAEHMLEVGTYNAIISPNEYYSPENSDFASSHKTFKRMMPTFAWEVLEVYSGPPVVAFRWRHWGEMKNDYVGFNDKGEKVTAKAHGGQIDIQGITIATLDEEMKVTHLDTFHDPMDMFRQIAPKGIVDKQPMNSSSPEAVVVEPGDPASTEPISSCSASRGRIPLGLLDKVHTVRGGFIGSLVSSAISSVRPRGRGSKNTVVSKSPTHESGKTEYYGGTVSGGSPNDASHEVTDKSRVLSAVVTRPEALQPKEVVKMDYDSRNIREDAQVAADQATAAAPHGHEPKRTHEEMAAISSAEC